MPTTHQRPDAADAATAGIYYGGGDIRQAERQKRPEESAKGGHRADHRSSILTQAGGSPLGEEEGGAFACYLPWSFADFFQYGQRWGH